MSAVTNATNEADGPLSVNEGNVAHENAPNEPNFAGHWLRVRCDENEAILARVVCRNSHVDNRIRR